MEPRQMTTEELERHVFLRFAPGSLEREICTTFVDQAEEEKERRQEELAADTEELRGEINALEEEVSELESALGEKEAKIEELEERVRFEKGRLEAFVLKLRQERL